MRIATVSVLLAGDLETQVKDQIMLAVNATMVDLDLEEKAVDSSPDMSEVKV